MNLKGIPFVEMPFFCWHLVQKALWLLERIKKKKLFLLRCNLQIANHHALKSEFLNLETSMLCFSIL